MVSRSQLYDVLFNGTVSSRLSRATCLFREFSEEITSNIAFSLTFSALSSAAKNLTDHMDCMKMGSRCCQCSKNAGGGCCSLLMSGETDAIQMFLNMLDGIEVKTVRNDGSGCIFLDKTGCIFTFKPMFCLNYNCKGITANAFPADLTELGRLTGTLLQLQHQAESQVLETLFSLPDIGGRMHFNP